MPSILVTDGSSTSRTVTQFRVIDGGGVDRVIQEARVIDPNGVDRIFYSTAPSLSISIDPTIVSGYTAGSGTADTDTATATATGGSSPYTYAWTLVDWSSPVTMPSALSPSTAATKFRQTGLAPDDSQTAIFRVTATDSNGLTVSDTINTNWASF